MRDLQTVKYRNWPRTELRADRRYDWRKSKSISDGDKLITDWSQVQLLAIQKSILNNIDKRPIHRRLISLQVSSHIFMSHVE